MGPPIENRDVRWPKGRLVECCLNCFSFFSGPSRKGWGSAGPLESAGRRRMTGKESRRG